MTEQQGHGRFGLPEIAAVSIGLIGLTATVGAILIAVRDREVPAWLSALAASCVSWLLGQLTPRPFRNGGK